MKYKKILITGGAGFVGSNLALSFKKKYPPITVTVLDNLKRRGSELNIQRLREGGVIFVHGDIRCPEDLENEKATDLILECSAEPSVLAGINSPPAYLLNTNLLGTINCLELARRTGADFVFLSTSRVYPIKTINSLNFEETTTRFELSGKQIVPGASFQGITEEFPLGESRSLYGATKLCSELILQEYIDSYNLKGIINRCGVITGPWQMGKVDQGVIALWVANHFFKKELSYIGYGGTGKQVRDFLHIDDLFDILEIQLASFDKFRGQIFNIGGGREKSLSLCELTVLCQKITGNKIKINALKKTRPADLRIYLTDTTKIKKTANWQPQRDAQKTVADIYHWIKANERLLKPIFN